MEKMHRWAESFKEDLLEECKDAEIKIYDYDDHMRICDDYGRCNWLWAECEMYISTLYI